MARKMSCLFGSTYYNEDDLAHEGFRSLGRNVRTEKNCSIVGAENISIGDNVRIDGYCTLVATDGGYLNLGSYIHIGGNCVLLAGAGITMEDFSGLSWDVQIFFRSDDCTGRYMTNPTVPNKYKRAVGGAILTSRYVIVGASTVIFPRVILCEGEAVGALSLLARNLEELTQSGTPLRKRVSDQHE